MVNFCLYRVFCKCLKSRHISSGVEKTLSVSQESIFLFLSSLEYFTFLPPLRHAWKVECHFVPILEFLAFSRRKKKYFITRMTLTIGYLSFTFSFSSFGRENGNLNSVISKAVNRLLVDFVSEEEKKGRKFATMRNFRHRRIFSTFSLTQSYFPSKWG